MRTPRQRQAIKIAMIRLGFSAADLARELKVSRPAVSRVISGAATSRRIGQALIEAGVPARLLPEYCDKSENAA